MNKRLFWKIIKMLDWDKEGNDELVLTPVIQYLSQHSDEEIFAFEDIMTQLLYDIDSKKIAEGLYEDTKYISADIFLYQRCVAIVNGQGYYNSILYGGRKLDPNLEFEAILYVPKAAWANKHNQDLRDHPHITKLSYETGSNKTLWQN